MTEDSKKIICSIEESNDKIDLSFDSVVMFKDSGTEEAYRRGYADGETEGFEQGYKDGHADGYDKGFDVGEQKGVEAGKAEGLEEGYDKGYVDGLAQRQYETWTMTLDDGSTVEKEIALL